MATFLRMRSAHKPTDEDIGGQMSFLEHLDELRRRLMWSIVFVVVAAMACWFASGRIYDFLAVPIEQALAEAQRKEVPIAGLTGKETIVPLNYLKENDVGRYVFAEETRIGTAVIPAGAAVTARYTKDAQGQLGLFTDEPLYAANELVPKGVRVPVDFKSVKKAGLNDRLIVNTAIEPFSLYVKVSLYAAVCISIPFLLWQIWAFVSPGLYPHERGYVFPFIGLSSVSFIIGGIFAYKIIFPPAAKYLLGLGHEFRLLLKADDYFDFIIMIMLGMGPDLSDARGDLRPRPHWACLGRFPGAYLEDFSNRDPDRGGDGLADQRYSKHDALRRADARLVRNFDCRGVDFREAKDGNLRWN